MDLVRKARERFRDQFRNDICAGLRSLGVNAQMAERGRVEEKIRSRSFGGKSLGVSVGGKSLGVIDIPDGPIRWINVFRFGGHVAGPGGSGDPAYFIQYGVPDTKLGSNSPMHQIKSTRIKNFPLFGRVVNLHWKGKDFGLGIIDRLNSDNSIKPPIMRGHDVAISTNSDHRCWILSTQTWDAPSEELWNCYQKIAQHLLAERK